MKTINIYKKNEKHWAGWQPYVRCLWCQPTEPHQSDQGNLLGVALATSNVPFSKINFNHWKQSIPCVTWKSQNRLEDRTCTMPMMRNRQAFGPWRVRSRTIIPLPLYSPGHLRMQNRRCRRWVSPLFMRLKTFLLFHILCDTIIGRFQMNVRPIFGWKLLPTSMSKHLRKRSCLRASFSTHFNIRSSMPTNRKPSTTNEFLMVVWSSRLPEMFYTSSDSSLNINEFFEPKS